MRDIVTVCDAILMEVPNEVAGLRAEIFKVQVCGGSMPEELKFKAWEMLDSILEDYDCSIEQSWKTKVRSIITGAKAI